MAFWYPRAWQWLFISNCSAHYFPSFGRDLVTQLLMNSIFRESICLSSFLEKSIQHPTKWGCSLVYNLVGTNSKRTKRNEIYSWHLKMCSKLFFNHAHQGKNMAQMFRLPLHFHNFYPFQVSVVLVYRFLRLSSCKVHE